MEVYKNQPPVIYRWPVDGGGSDIVKGALLMRGATAETNLGALIVASGANPDAVGVLLETHDFSVVGDTVIETGAAWVTHPVALIDPINVMRVEYDQSDTAAIASMNSTTSVRITSIEDNIDSGWLYVVSGTGIGSLHYIKSDDGTDLVIKEATTAIAADTVIKILPLFHPLCKWNAAGDKLGTDAAAGSGLVCILQNYIQIDNVIEELNPTKHSGLTGLNSRAVKFFADLVVRNTAYHTID